MKKLLLLLLLMICIISCKDDQKQKAADTQNEIESEQNNETQNPNTNNVDRANSSSKLTNVDLNKEVENFIICKKAATERNDCRNSITKVITKAFGLTEFNDQKLGYMVYDSIRPIAARSRNWLQLGSVNQETIDQALAHANRGGLALIIDTAETYGHVVMIVPGESKKSGSWEMSLPNVLSLTNYKPEKSFSNKSLSYAMKKSDDLKIFIRQ
ncbi:hypothetical protein [Aquimarina sp. 2201CG14-23]|uniref:hypothetical protein n=1 Tax=Aquimarina mycalae TaxID=3040073 RepID=UPI0024781B68|nr:hypothetical protein [Aquimarina sp. 2201CG14-23]MDH7447748.1 hypothetical protein [Aquimarina sp. 2201CG14-23]